MAHPRLAWCDSANHGLILVYILKRFIDPSKTNMEPSSYSNHKTSSFNVSKSKYFSKIHYSGYYLLIDGFSLHQVTQFISKLPREKKIKNRKPYLYKNICFWKLEELQICSGTGERRYPFSYLFLLSLFLIYIRSLSLLSKIWLQLDRNLGRQNRLTDPIHHPSLSSENRVQWLYLFPPPMVPSLHNTTHV